MNQSDEMRIVLHSSFIVHPSSIVPRGIESKRHAPQSPGGIMATVALPTVRAVCPHDCPDTCGMSITVRDGRAVELRGDPDHPFTRGFLCGKVAHYLDRVYHPERL